MTKLNLYTKGDGLDGTHVTWDDIQKGLQEELHTEAVFGEKKSFVNIGDGKGYMSRICLVTPDWQNVKTGEHLPEKFVAKLCSMLNVIQVMTVFRGEESEEQANEFYGVMEISAKKLHNAECTVYEQIIKQKPNITSAKIYCVRRFTDESPVKGMILMEFLEDLYFPPMYENFSIDEAKQVLRSAAKWSASSLKFTELEIDQFPDNPLTTIFKDLYNPQSLENLLGKMKTFNDGMFEKDAIKLEQLLPELMDFYYFDRIPDLLQMKRVLCHGDMWNYNVLWRKKGDHLELASVIDYQTAHFGSPAADIVRILCAAVGGKERQENFEAIVKYYYEQFIEEVDGEAPFTFEQLFESCKRFFPVGAFMIVSTFPAAFDMMFKDLEPVEKQLAINNCTEKCRHAYNDIFLYLEQYRSTK